MQYEIPPSSQFHTYAIWRIINLINLCQSEFCKGLASRSMFLVLEL